MALDAPAVTASSGATVAGEVPAVARGPGRTSRGFLTVAAGSIALTTAVALLPGLDYTYHRDALHVALESGGALVSIVAGFLVFGRLRIDAKLYEAVLLCGLGVLVATNFAYGVVLDATAESRGTVAIWAALIGKSVGCFLVVAAAFAPPRTLRHPRRGAVIGALVSLGIVLAIGSVVAAFRDSLPSGISVELPPAPSGRPHLAGDPSLLALQLAAAVLYGAAALAFERRRRSVGDTFMGWLAIACVLAAFAHLNYFLYPSLFSDWVSVGDLFRIAFFVALLAGALSEIASYWKATAAAAALGERHRIAQDLHDGLAQEIAFIRRNLPLLRETDVENDLPKRLEAAADRAYHEARQVIETLAEPDDEPLEGLLNRILGETAARHGARLELSIAPDIRLDPIRREALLRVAQEAVTNAATHSGAQSVLVEIGRHEGRTQLRVTDDGRGFDPDGVIPAGHFGLVSMRKRAAAIGADFSLRTSPDCGTTVLLAL